MLHLMLVIADMAAFLNNSFALQCYKGLVAGKKLVPQKYCITYYLGIRQLKPLITVKNCCTAALLSCSCFRI